MKIVVIYDTVFGNTRKVAETIAGSIADSTGKTDDVSLLLAGEVTPASLAGIRLVVIGSPTRAFKPMRDVLKAVRAASRTGIERYAFAVFDTRIPIDDIDVAIARRMQARRGYAAEQLATEIEKLGGRVIGEITGFSVAGSEGPLKPTELERAGQWARSIRDAYRRGG